MMNIRRNLVLVLIAAIFLSSITYADTSNVKFTDINNNWAKQHIINVVDKGLMTGITATLFKPADKVTHFQALVSISKMTKANEKYDLAALETKYKTAVLDKYNVPSNVRKEIAYSLEAGIIKAADLSVLNQSSNVTKQLVCAYIAKAMGVIYDAQKPIVFLGYSDAMFIIKENKTYIKHLIDIGALSSKGDDAGRFNPDSVITRDVFAKMMDIASNKYNETNPVVQPKPTTPTPEVPSPTPTEPTVPSVETPVPAPNIPTTTENPKPITETTAYTGIIEQVLVDYNVIVFKSSDNKGTNIRKAFVIENDMKFIIDGSEETQLWKIKNGDKASIYIKDEKLIKLEIDRKNQAKNEASSVKGTIETLILSRTAPAKMIIATQDGQKVEYDISKTINKQSIIIADKESELYDLRPGMQVNVELQNNEVVKIATINVSVPLLSLEGTIKAIDSKLGIVTLDYYDTKQQKYVDKKIAAFTAKISDKTAKQYSLSQLQKGMKLSITGTEGSEGFTAANITINN